MILLTGGSGLLGKELQKHIECLAPSKKEFNITSGPEFLLDHLLKFEQGRNLISDWKIVHCAAFTDVVTAEHENKQLCYDTNVIGTRNLAALGIPMLYISTEYVFDGEKGDYTEENAPNPQNFYSLTKLLGEYESRATKSVVVRCLFKPRPFEWPAACVDQFTTGDYVDRIAEEITVAVKKFDRLPATIHIGTGKKSTYDLAKESRPDVRAISVGDIKTVKLPRDTSLNTKLWEKIKNEN